MYTLLRILKWTGIILLIVAFILVAAVFSRQDLQFEAPLPELHASMDSAVIAHGEYLVNGPAHCSGCHTDNAHEAAYLRGETVPMHGGYAFKLPVGTVFSKNITNDQEHGIGRLTDPEIARTLRYGVGSDGRAILDFMPYYMLSDEDLTAVISYLRTLPGNAHAVPADDLNFIGKAVKAFLIKPAGPLGTERPKGMRPDTTAAYGEYLANSVANCVGCHTARDLMTGAFTGKPFAGWMNMEGNVPGTFFNTPNLTPEPTTGHLANWTFEVFQARFRSGPVFPESPMPWASFRRMRDADLKAIWNYLQTLPPVVQETGPLKAPKEHG